MSLYFKDEICFTVTEKLCDVFLFSYRKSLLGPSIPTSMNALMFTREFTCLQPLVPV